MVVLYHYTSKEGATAIKRDKKIKKSVYSGGDAWYGEGTYFTSLSPPKHTQSMVVHNNWAVPRSLVDEVDRLRVEYVIQVTFPDDDPNLQRCESQRDIWLYAGSDVNLHCFHYKITEFSEFNSRKMVRRHGRYTPLICS